MPEPAPRWVRMKPNTSATVTSTGSLPTTVKNTFKSYAVAHNVFRRQRARTTSR